MGKVWTKDEVAPSLINGKLVELTDEQKQAKVDEWNAYEAKSGERKLKKIRELRQDRLVSTDYMASSDVTMPDNIKTWRQSLRDIPQDYTTESQYDLLLARDSDGKLTHSIWEKP
tara:strand:- start:138 stop:482 length:345 start_codon:yes stop_codon:yes gene_type:complete